MSSMVIFDLSIFSDDLAAGGAAFFAGIGAGASSASSAGAAGAAAAFAAGAAPEAPPARAAASMSATLILERSTFAPAGFAAGAAFVFAGAGVAPPAFG